VCFSEDYLLAFEINENEDYEKLSVGCPYHEGSHQPDTHHGTLQAIALTFYTFQSNI